MKKVHKARFSEHSPCGEAYFSAKGKLETAWHWKKVTCEKCLAKRPVAK